MTTGFGSQLSVAVTAAGFGAGTVSPHRSRTGPGQVMRGGVVSRTMTRKVQRLVFPAASVAVQTTVFVPSGKIVPLGGTHTTITPGQLSIAVTLNVTGVPLVHSITRFVGQLIVGGVVSATVTTFE